MRLKAPFGLLNGEKGNREGGIFSSPSATFPDATGERRPGAPPSPRCPRQSPQHPRPSQSPAGCPPSPPLALIHKCALSCLEGAHHPWMALATSWPPEHPLVANGPSALSSHPRQRRAPLMRPGYESVTSTRVPARDSLEMHIPTRNLNL